MGYNLNKMDTHDIEEYLGRLVKRLNKRRNKLEKYERVVDRYDKICEKLEAQIANIRVELRHRKVKGFVMGD